MFEDLTIEKLRSLTKEQILTAINNKFQNLTKKGLIILTLRIVGVDIENFETSKETGEDGPNGQIWRLRVARDVLDNKLGSTRFDWTYHPGIEGKRPVHLITETKFDAADQMIGEPKVIARHPADGKLEEI